MLDSNETFVNQDNREVVIKKLDESKEKVELEDLFLFDLSPYYHEKLDDSFFSKQLEFIQEKNELNHNSKISFTSEQIRIYNGIVENDRSIVSAPTSFGKTMLVKEYIYNFQPDKVVFIVPTNSLADELLDDFKRLFTSLGYIVFDSLKGGDSIIQKSVFIGTQEKYYNLKSLYKEKIDLFVIDEAYKLTDSIKGSREVILNRSFIDTLDTSKKIILLMPLVNSIVGLENFGFEILKSDYAPVAKNFNSIKKLNEVIKDEISKNEKTNLIYFNYPKELEKNYLKEFSMINNSTELDDSWFHRVEKDFHPDWIPIQALKAGIGIHYGPMPKFVQKKVIDLFKASKIKNVLATNSIIEGVNTPTKNIYIYNSKDILNDKDLVKYKNLIGRAGRLGEHKVGNIFYWSKHQTQFEKANVSFKDINIQFVLENKNEIIEINREDNFNEQLYTEDTGLTANSLKKYLEESNYWKVPQIDFVKLIDKHGFTIKKLKFLLEYIDSTNNIKLLGIIGKFYYGQDLKLYDIILNSKYKSFYEMVEEFHPFNVRNIKIKRKKKINEYDIHKSVTISLVMDMIYSKFPFDIIPLINFIIDIDKLYKEHNEISLLPDKLIIEAKSLKAQFYSKFIGLDNSSHDYFVVVNKLFEYGIPYQRVKPFLSELYEVLPNEFSIHDIKNIIFNNSSMSDLKVYFN